ncbi:MAG: hypothetical protein QGG21_06160 [Candidatus Thalassarchaeaceae archaeon]|nr:hypothetical protein [Candidatus Thalassarchaeaceae archaeon]
MTDAKPRVGVKQALFAALLVLLPLTSGCLEVPTVRPCPDDTCFPLTSDAFDTLISKEGSFDVLALASDNERVRVRSTLVQEHNGERGEIVWDVAKDETAGLRYVSTRYVVAGTILIDTEMIDGQGTTNVRSGSKWYQGRDAEPNLGDPFLELAQKATLDPGGLWPPFDFDTSALSGLSWTITGDALSSQQVASASNGTHDFIVELYGLSPRIKAIEVYSGDEYEFTIRVTTGEEVSIELQEGLPRSQVPFVPQEPDLVATYGDTTVLFGSVPAGMAHEADLSEMVIHTWSDGDTAASMRLDWEEANVTADDGTWWSIIWLDAGTPGLFSSIDEYRIRTNSTMQFEVRLYDLWSDCWTDRQL